MFKINQSAIKDVYIKYAGVLLILVLTLYNLRDLDLIHILHDEYGYWAAGAFFAGRDWSEITSYTAYYSYGYGFILAPLICFMKNASHMYKAAIVINALMLVGTYFIAILCIQKLFPDISKMWTYAIAMFSTIYCNNLIQAQVTWSETLLYFLFWVIMWFMISLYENPAVWKTGVLAVLSIYSYTVHQRCLAIIVAVVIMIILFKGLKKITWKEILGFVVILCAMCILHMYLKDLIKTELYLDGVIKSMDGNDFAGQTSKITAILTSWDGFFTAVIGFIGKTFYLSAASLGVVFIGLYYAIKKLLLHKDELQTYICLFVVLSTIFALGINAISILHGSRADCVVYGRYTEYVIGPLLVLGFIALKCRFVHIKELVGIYGSTLIMGSMAAVYAQSVSTLDFNAVCSVGAYLFFRNITNIVQPYIRMLFTLLTVFLIFVVLYFKTKEKKHIFMIMLFMMCGCFWIVTSAYIGPYLEVADFQDIQKISNVIYEYSEDEDIRVAYVTDKNPGDGRFIEYYRFLIPDSQMSYHSVENEVKLDDNTWIIRNTEDSFFMLEDYTIVARWDQMDLMVKNDSLIKEKMDNNCMDYIGEDNTLVLTERDVMSKNKDLSSIQWQSDGTEGHLTYGPYMYLDKGDYQLEFVLNISGGNTVADGDTAVHIDIFSQGDVLAEIFITEIGTDICVEIPFSLTESRELVEFRTKVEEGYITQIETMRLIKNK